MYWSRFSPELDLYKAMRYKYMKVRFGRISVDYYKRLEKYLFEDLDACISRRN